MVSVVRPAGWVARVHGPEVDGWAPGMERLATAGALAAVRCAAAAAAGDGVAVVQLVLLVEKREDEPQW